MEINQVLKQATAYKKTNGYSYALGYLINNYDSNKPDDLHRLLHKIYTYFSRDLENKKVKEFIKQLIKSGAIDQYSGSLSAYNWILKDYESYKLTIMNQLSKVNPNDPWRYVSDICRLQFSLCKYYRAIGLENERNAIEYLYNLLSSTFFDIASELIMYASNFHKYHMYLQYGSEKGFYHPDRLIPLSESIEKIFDDNSVAKNYLKTLKCTIPVIDITFLIKKVLFRTFSKELGFKIDILDAKFNDLAIFALSFFCPEDYEDILILSDKIYKWKIHLAGKTADIAMDETNNILEVLTA